MSLDKSIENGREHREPYRGSKAIDRTCRNHGGKTKRREHGQCPWCKGNFLYKSAKDDLRIKEEKRLGQP